MEVDWWYVLIGMTAAFVLGASLASTPSSDWGFEIGENMIVKVYNWENGNPELFKLYTDDPDTHVICSGTETTSHRNLTLLRYNCGKHANLDGTWKYEKLREEFRGNSEGAK